MFKCTFCKHPITRHIHPSDIARRKHLFCCPECNYKFQTKKKPKNKIKRLGVIRKQRPPKDIYTYSSKKPAHCPAKVESCLDCPFPKCDY